MVDAYHSKEIFLDPIWDSVLGKLSALRIGARRAWGAGVFWGFYFQGCVLQRGACAHPGSPC